MQNLPACGITCLFPKARDYAKIALYALLAKETEIKKKRKYLLFMAVTKEVTKEDQQKALEAAIKQIERDFGQGAVMKLGDSVRDKSIEVIPTGSLSLDYALGVGGVPKDPSPPVRRHWHSMSLPKHRRWAALPVSSMRSMRWIRSMRRTSA